MSERLNKVEANITKNPELERLAAEKLRSSGRKVEHEHNRTEAVEAAREQLKHAEQVKPATEKESAPQEPIHRTVITKATNYTHTMISLRHRMKPAARTFSRVIHAPGVEAVSELAGKTVFRPSATLGATICALLLTGFLYIYARSHGLVMPVSAVWIALLLGALIGIVIEYSLNLTHRVRGR